MTILYRHKESGALVELAERSESAVRFYPQGGGLSCKAPAATFDEQFERATEPAFRPGTVSLETLPEVKLPCYSNGMRKNGFGIPWFDEAGVNMLIQAIEPHLAIGEPPSIKLEGDSFTVYDPGEEQYFPCSIRTEMIDGAQKKMWQIGDGWCWLEVDFEGDGPPAPCDEPDEDGGAPAP